MELCKTDTRTVIRLLDACTELIEKKLSKAARAGCSEKMQEDE